MTNLTVGSIREAASVLDSLSDSDVQTHRNNRHAWRAQAIVLREVADRIEQGRAESMDEALSQVVPIPGEAMTPEAFEQVLEHVHGSDDDQSS